ncbi:MAG: class I SAM-dependent methyltransferase [Erysipelotrichales bacterium]
MSNLIRISDYTKLVINNFIDKDMNAIDMTLGNGHDSEYLANHFNKVYAFDIQEQAIQNSKDFLKEYSNIEYYLDSHENFDKYNFENIKVYIFNLGYLPGFDKDITTNIDSTLNAIKKVIAQMKKGTLLSITIYPGHQEGNVEKEVIEEYINTLDSSFHISKYSIINNEMAPYVISIHKNKNML